MKHGFIKVAAAAPKVTVADPSANLQEILALHAEADREGVALLVYPELCLTGYTCADLFFSSVLIRAAENALSAFLEQTKQSPIVSILGFPLVVNDKLYNCAVICQKGKILGVVPKSNIPNHNEQGEARFFSPYTGEVVEVSLCSRRAPFGAKQLFACKPLPAFRFGVEICEDLWSASLPSVGLCEAGALVIANLSASAELAGKSAYRRMLVTSQSARATCGYIFSNCGAGESTTDLVFGGHALIAENGEILAERPAFTEEKTPLLITELDLDKLASERRRISTNAQKVSHGYLVNSFSIEVKETTLTRKINPYPFLPADPAEWDERFETVLSIQARGLAQRITRAYAKKCVIGISGGLDSCLAILVAVRAMDRLGRPHSDVLGVTMPCFGTTNRTKSNAEKLCDALGTELRCVSIGASVRQHFADIGQDESKRDVTYENAQARERTQVLMDLANMVGGIVVGTGDLSELALGWATYNGDHMSMYGVNGGLPKTFIRHVVRYCADGAESDGNEALAAVLRDILDTPVSPELLPADEGGNIAQKTEDLVGPYEIHDFYIYHLLRFGYAPDKLYRLAKVAFAGVYDDETLLKWLKNLIRRFFAQQFKRSCLPDGPKVGSVGLSPRGDWQMPSDASAAEWLRITENL